MELCINFNFTATATVYVIAFYFHAPEIVWEKYCLHSKATQNLKSTYKSIQKEIFQPIQSQIKIGMAIFEGRR